VAPKWAVLPVTTREVSEVSGYPSRVAVDSEVAATDPHVLSVWVRTC
jgi:hypothetical protein